MISPDSLDNRGAIANVLVGYGRAWRHWPRLLPALAPIVLPVLLVKVVLRLLTTGEEGVIVNGVMSLLPSQEDVVAWVEPALTAAGWAWAVGAGTVVVAGVLRGVAVRPGAGVLSGLYRTPELFVALFLIGVGWFAVTAVGGLMGPIAALVALVAGGLVVARLLLVVPAVMLRGEVYGVWKLARGRMPTILGMVVLGVFAIPFALRWVTGTVSDVVSTGAIPGEWTAVVLSVVAQTVDAVALMAVVAGQAGTLALAYLLRRDEKDNGSVADLAAVDDRLAGMTGTGTWHVRGAWVAAASLMLPALMAAGVALVNPYATASIQAHPIDLSGEVFAVGWPDGGHPVIVTAGSARFCHDDECREFTVRTSRVPVMAGHGVAAVGADGSVVKATTTGSDRNGGPFVELGRCTIDGCERGWIPTRASSEEAFVWPKLGLGVSPHGVIYIAMVAPLSQTPTPEQKSKAELTLIRCEDVKCVRPQRHTFGVFAGNVTHRQRNLLRPTPDVRVSFDDKGSPLISYRLTSQVVKVSCFPSTCDNGRTVVHQSHSLLHQYLPLPGVDRGVLTLGGSQLWHCRDKVCTDTVLEGCCVDERLNGFAHTASGTFAVFATPGPPREGVYLRFGEPEPEPHRLVLWHCPDLGCTHPRRIPLTVTDTELTGIWVLERGGQVLILAAAWKSSTFISLSLV